MTRLRIVLSAFLISASVASSTGCNLLHNLQPHRLHRLNRQPSSASAAMFSVQDGATGESPVEEFMSSTELVEMEE
ncbi:hypothetical protein Pla110_16180 [Polystyrenella longa]|uniref:Lipoprotein n=1 Tax=Polystyrenella longa TaxID=2528007 RepID=A0A518CKZ5_9PLAN|nr:hypothetical protein [Polystyrenella longa]QDU79898.1 hypothetical protein Pla110_16180 [Polystyrenella longa]